MVSSSWIANYQETWLKLTWLCYLWRGDCTLSQLEPGPLISKSKSISFSGYHIYCNLKVEESKGGGSERSWRREKRRRDRVHVPTDYTVRSEALDLLQSSVPAGRWLSRHLVSHLKPCLTNEQHWLYEQVPVDKGLCSSSQTVTWLSPVWWCCLAHCAHISFPCWK